MRFGGLLHLLQDERRDLRGRILLAVGLDPGVAVRGADDLVGNELLVLLHHRIVIAPADQSLDGEEGALRIGDCLAFRRLPGEPLTILGEGHDRGRGAHALRILDDPGRRAIHDRNAGIGRAKVDADDLCHGSPLFPAGRPSLTSARKEARAGHVMPAAAPGPTPLRTAPPRMRRPRLI